MVNAVLFGFFQSGWRDFVGLAAMLNRASYDKACAGDFLPSVQVLAVLGENSLIR
jgi:hypothetical protein